jgi:thiol-disulfide isomerase/thioredoxin
MRHLLLVFMLVVAAVRSVPAQDAVLAPDWTLSTAAGREINLGQEAKQQTTILLFWATWCPYCKALMPQLQSVQQEYGTSVKILAIDVMDDGDPVGFIKNSGYDFTLLLRGDAVFEQYGLTGTPGVFIVDNNRRIRFDLRQVPRIDLPKTEQAATNGGKAAYLAHYWAAEIRKSLDQLLGE